MTRAIRLDLPGYFYHVINRTNFKFQMFNSDSDYIEFIKIIREALEVAPVKIYAYCIMPNHWHFLISPYEEGGIGKFMHALTNKHTRRYHTKTKTIGNGPLYQGRYKSMVVDSDVSFLMVFRYIERNAVRAALSITPDEWRWGSAWLRKYGNEKQKMIIDEVPHGITSTFGNISHYVSLPDEIEDIKKIHHCIQKGTPFGREKWVDKMIADHGLEITIRSVGRQRLY